MKIKMGDLEGGGYCHLEESGQRCSICVLIIVLSTSLIRMLGFIRE